MNTNRRFLNYKEYENFKLDLRDGKISEDTIVFIQDKRCIWARGKEYTGNLALDYNKESKIATLKTADGESIVDFVDKDEYIDFKSTFINFVANEYAVFKNNINTSLTTVTDELLAEIDRSVLVDNDIDTRLANEITNRQVSYDGLSLNIGRVESELLNNIENVNNNLTSTKATLNEVDNRVDSLENLIEADQDGIINKFNEIVSFLNRIDDEVALKSILDAIDDTITDIKSKYELKEDHDTDKRDIYSTILNVLSTINGEIELLKTTDLQHGVDIQNLQDSKQDNLLAGEGISIEDDTVSVVDYIGEREINAKLKTLLEYLANQYVLKKDVHTPETNEWSDATVYPFGELPESEIGETPMHTDIEVYSEDIYEQLERDGAIRNDICYFIYE